MLGAGGARILSEEVIPTENICQVLQNTNSGKFFMTYYNSRKELKVASIAKSELDKYWTYKELGVKYIVVLQHLKTKDRIIIRV